MPENVADGDAEHHNSGVSGHIALQFRKAVPHVSALVVASAPETGWKKTDREGGSGMIFRMVVRNPT